MVVDVTAEELVCVRQAGFEWVQCHGSCPDELPSGLQGLRAFSGLSWTGQERLPGEAWHAWLLDGPQSGSGQSFDWSRLAARNPDQRIFVAGGLDPINVGHVVARLRPYGVDVSSGVESSAGVKDASRVREFIKRARNQS